MKNYALIIEANGFQDLERLNKYLSQGWTVKSTEAFRGFAGNNAITKEGSILVILEKE